MFKLSVTCAVSPTEFEISSSTTLRKQPWVQIDSVRIKRGLLSDREPRVLPSEYRFSLVCPGCTGYNFTPSWSTFSSKSFKICGIDSLLMALWNCTAIQCVLNSNRLKFHTDSTRVLSLLTLYAFNPLNTALPPSHLLCTPRFFCQICKCVKKILQIMLEKQPQAKHAFWCVEFLSGKGSEFVVKVGLFCLSGPSGCNSEKPLSGCCYGFQEPLVCCPIPWPVACQSPLSYEGNYLVDVGAVLNFKLKLLATKRTSPPVNCTAASRSFNPLILMFFP